MTEPTPPPSEPGTLDRLTTWIQEHALVVGGIAAAGLLAVVAMGIALATGGGDSTAAADSTTSTTASLPDDTAAPGESTPPPTATTTPPPDPIENPSALVAIKIDNAEQARPQIGLNAARYLFEVPVEGGMTRFLGFFEAGTDTLVGPVRSARPVDVDLVGLLSSTLVSTGGRPFVLGALTGNGIELVGADPASSPFQSLERPTPHHLFLALNDIPSPDPVEFGLPDADFPTSGTTVETVDVPLTEPVRWTFADGVYMRGDGSATTQVLPDWDTDPEPLTTETVVVMGVNPRSAGYQDSAGTEVPTFDVIGSGSLAVHNGGTVVEGTWQRASLSDPYRFLTTDGDEFGLPDGRVFIHLLPTP